jgi:site-specific recombinase XerC
MTDTPETAPLVALINLKTYAARLGVTRQAVHYQLVRGICAVPPVTGIKPPKWRASDVQAYLASVKQ